MSHIVSESSASPFRVNHDDVVKLVRDKTESARANRTLLSPGITCVLGIGDRRPAELYWLLAALSHALRNSLRKWDEAGWIRLNPISQAHFTLLGLEAKRRSTTPPGGLANVNLTDRYNSAHNPEHVPAMNLSGLLKCFVPDRWPIELKFGGYKVSDGNCNPFDKLRPPYERTFSVRPDGNLVLMGWPPGFLPTILEVRKSAEEFNAVHAWHLKPNDEDNDCYSVIGYVTEEPWRSGSQEERSEFLIDLARAQGAIRNHLAAHCQTVAFALEHCSIVAYNYTTLADPCIVIALSDATEDTLPGMYS